MHYDQFSKANLTRCEAIDGFNHKLSAWSISDWLVAFVGEFGEMCNVQKKLNRVHSGIRGNREATPDLVQKRRRELGDAGVYLDLIAQRMGFNLLDAMVEVFNLKSEELGYPVQIPVEVDPTVRIPPLSLTAEQIDPESTSDRMERQSHEFSMLDALIKTYTVLPAVVDDDYPEARHYYEGALRGFLEACKNNGRI